MSKFIPDSALENGYTGMVHVEGFRKGAVFMFKGFDAKGYKILETPKTKKVTVVDKRLIYTRQHAPRSTHSSK